MHIGSIRAADRDETDIILVQRKMSIKTIRASSVAIGLMARVMPRPVAMPFPPLNFSQTGKICPKNAKKAIIYTWPIGRKCKASIVGI